MCDREIIVDGSTARVPLSGGHVAIIDATDAERVAQYTWSALVSKGKVYARRTIRTNGKQRTVLLHRWLMSAPECVHIDHEDGDGLNCRRANLRFATQAQNNLNTKLRTDNACGFKGVRKHSLSPKFQASIAIGGKRHHLGMFDTAELAHAAYCSASAELHKDFGRTA
jgi:hypothetical protein